MANLVETSYKPTRVSHPGETLKESLKTLRMTQKALAQRMGNRPEKTISEIIKGKASITPETALQLEQVLGTPAHFWLLRQTRYDEYVAVQRETEANQKKVRWLSNFNVKEIFETFGLTRKATKAENVKELLAFFGVATPEAWSIQWKEIAIDYRKSRYHQNEFGALSAWLRFGELEAQKIECAPFDKKQFRSALDDIRALTKKPPKTFIPRMTELCAQSGVALMIAKEISGTHVSGATRWLNSQQALIQMTLRYKTNDHFWFTFFHEAAHILIHSKHETFLEYKTNTSTEEKSADRFASEHLIPPNDMKKLLSENYYDVRTIKDFALEIGIAPGIVVGRLQHDQCLPYSSGLNRLKQRFQWS